jgi:ubiquinone/menaquinone biosynthesis C-methylase UbiE
MFELQIEVETSEIAARVANGSGDQQARGLFSAARCRFQPTGCVIVKARLARSLFVWLIGCAAGVLRAAEPSVAPGINDRYATEEGRKTAIQIFEGEGREQYQKPEEVTRNMALEKGSVVCEVGAGSGYFTPYLSRAVGANGKVYAEDPQPEFLDVLKQKIASQNLNNVTVVLGTYTDTNLPDKTCDVAFVLDAYHHFEWPEPMLAAMAKDLKPGGRLIIVDWHRRQNEIFDRSGIDAQKHLRLDREGVVREIESYGWKNVDTRSFLEHQYFLVFERR